MEPCRGTKHTAGGTSFPTHRSLQPNQIIRRFCRTALTLVLHSLTVQSKEEVTNRWEKSRGPAAVWQLIPVMGPWWPSNISLMPALLSSTQKTKSRLSANVLTEHREHQITVEDTFSVHCMKGTNKVFQSSGHLITQQAQMNVWWMYLH